MQVLEKYRGMFETQGPKMISLEMNEHSASEHIQVPKGKLDEASSITLFFITQTLTSQREQRRYLTHFYFIASNPLYRQKIKSQKKKEEI